MKKTFAIIFILVSAISFTIYNSSIKQKNLIINKFSQVQTNYEILSFYDKDLCNEVSNNMKLPLDDILAVGYLSDSSEKIYIKNNQPINKKQFDKLLKIAREKNFRIYNNHSKKYHTLSCKYGSKSHNLEIIPLKDIPKYAKPCKVCIDNHHQKSYKKKKIFVPLIITTKNLKIILSDFTENLKPNRECNNIICQELVSDINKSKSTIDIAIYGYDKVPAIEFALSNAIKRGVKVRLVYDIDSKNNNIYSDTKYMANFIKDSKNDISDNAKYTNALMHNKFYIFDSKKVITGSANMSFTDMSGFNSNSIAIINSPNVAKIYEEEFEQMYKGNFHNLKNPIHNSKNLIAGDSQISVYFSPKDNSINKAILPLINSATKYIYIPTFLITERKMTEALINAKKRGVDIKIIIDAVNAKNKSSKHKILRENGIQVKTENYAGKLHSKSIIIDDKYTIIGSMNFSFSGNTKNDENLIVIENNKIAKFYRNFFEYLWGKIPAFWLTHDVSAESIYSKGSCSDGIDNDFDGKIDTLDEGCNIKHKK